MLYNFKLGHNVVEATKNICNAKSEDTFDYGIVTRCFKKFRCKKLDDQARPGGSKTVDFESVLQAIEETLESSTLRVPGELSISQSSVTSTTSGKASEAAELCVTLSKYCEIFD